MTLDKLGHRATFRCDVGYQLQGPAEINCEGAGPRGAWSDSPPSCNRMFYFTFTCDFSLHFISAERHVIMQKHIPGS